MYKIKQKLNSFIFIVLIYVVGYTICNIYFSVGKTFEAYTAGWFTHSSLRMFIPVAISLILLFLGKNITAIATTVSCFAGMLIGEWLGGFIRNVNLERINEVLNSGISVDSSEIAHAHMHYGIIPIWVTVFIATVVIGLILDKKRNKKN
ncbi:hypothetical protein [Vallitalea okinawensis]|uniref:hypothetical protein n=1 Tax=Vallitalea okinawensis TaxID=2078660 RepID=UPI000CFB3CA3|nr:hypothetical protein [Vallitalea okinawensis]